MEGVEPSSKQGTQKLSTRLADRLVLLSPPGRRQPNGEPSPLSFALRTGRPQDYPFEDDTSLPKARKAGADGEVLVPEPPWAQELSHFTW